MSIQSSPHRSESLRRRALRAAACFPAFFGLCGAFANAFPATPRANAAFFASPRACALSKILSGTECDAAFGAAIREARALGLNYASQFDCVARFRLCERMGGGGAPGTKRAFRPVLLGIEVANSPHGRLTKPVFAADPPADLLPQKPAASGGPRAMEERGAPARPAKPAPPGAELPTDHFERVDFWTIKKHWSGFRLDAAAPTTISAAEESRPHETPRQRRERLQNAPYIE